MTDLEEIKRRRTFAIISHPDAGKTTLTEKLLLYGGAIHLAGSVKARKTARYAVSDWMEIEKQRGISVTSSVLAFDYGGCRVNILDTPGHADFSEDTYRTLMAVDSAVMVIDVAKGVEAQTKKLFKVCSDRGIPIFTFVNKIDHFGKNPFDLMADIECLRFPQMATVRPGTFPIPEEREGTGTAIYWQHRAVPGKEIISEERVIDTGSDIRDARILIALGDGIRDRSLIDVAESVATKVGGMVCCSRSLVEKGWMPRSRQVGMSGRTVAPDLYIAFGISGAVQHRAGMSSSGRVIAVNNDPDAPIHRYADLSLIADAGDILREMDRSLRS